MRKAALELEARRRVVDVELTIPPGETLADVLDREMKRLEAEGDAEAAPSDAQQKE